MGIGRRIDPADMETSPKQAKAPAVTFTPETPKFTLQDIVLNERTKEQILDAADYARNSEIVFETWGLAATHKYSRRLGINLYGPSGTGKTMAAHAIAAYLGRKILIVNYADIESKYVGETPKNIRKAFEAAKETNSILFFDEADAILSKRVTNMSSATDVSVNQTRSVMLMLLNDYQDFVIFATNFIENFDPAFMRRIAMHVKFELPDVDCRRRLWRMYIPRQMPNDIDIDHLAETFDGLSGSDIANAVLMGAFKAARKRKEKVEERDVEEMVQNILESKKANRKYEVTVTKQPVSEEYVKQQLAKKG